MSEQPKVVSLNGAPVRGEASDEIVKTIQDLLDRARRGEIVSLGVAFVAPNDVVHAIISQSGHPTAHQLVAASCYLHRRCVQSAEVD